VVASFLKSNIAEPLSFLLTCTILMQIHLSKPPPPLELLEIEDLLPLEVLDAYHQVLASHGP
jgi:hypothetical protein